MPENRTVTWRDLLLSCGGAIAISVGCSWAVSLVISRASSKRADVDRQYLQGETDSINDRLNARWRDIGGDQDIAKD